MRDKSYPDRLRDAVHRVNGILRELDTIDALLDQAVAMAGARAVVLCLLKENLRRALEASKDNGARSVLSWGWITREL